MCYSLDKTIVAPTALKLKRGGRGYGDVQDT